MDGYRTISGQKASLPIAWTSSDLAETKAAFSDEVFVSTHALDLLKGLF